jgi:LytS/YehU family sensor histidine kinase
VNVENSGLTGNGTADSIAKGIGLTNTEERLQTLYGADHGFALQWMDSGGCEVTLDVPFRPCERVTGAALVCVS